MDAQRRDEEGDRRRSPSGGRGKGGTFSPSRDRLCLNREGGWERTTATLEQPTSGVTDARPPPIHTLRSKKNRRRRGRRRRITASSSYHKYFHTVSFALPYTISSQFSMTTTAIIVPYTQTRECRNQTEWPDILLSSSSVIVGQFLANATEASATRKGILCHQEVCFFQNARY